LASNGNFGVNDVNVGLAKTDLRVAIANIIRIFLGFLGLIATILILYGGYIWMTAAGDAGKVEKAKKILTNAVIGLIIILMSFIIVSFVINAFGGTGTPGGQPGNNPTIPDLDLGRGSIGAGPIESVYPAPGQTDVFINTGIIVTFKESILASSICTMSGTTCAMKDTVEICQYDKTQPDGCAINGSFTTSTYVGSAVTSTDGHTFVFTPKKTLGNADNTNVVFQVRLKNGILRTRDNLSIFEGWKTDYYRWDFTTNGKLDLNPPMVQSLFPTPDGKIDSTNAAGADTYTAASLATKSSTTFNTAGFVVGHPNLVDGRVYIPGTPLSFFMSTTTGSAPTAVHLKAVVNAYSFASNGDLNLEVSSSGDAVFTGVLSKTVASSALGTNGYLDTGKGIIISPTDGTWASLRGTKWKFSVYGAATGTLFQIKSADGVNKVGFVIATSSDTRNTIEVVRNASTQEKDIYNVVKVNSDGEIASKLATAINAKASSIVTANGSGNLLSLTSATAGASVPLYMKDNDGVYTSLANGKNDTNNRTVVGQTDPYRNAGFQIVFNKAINPAYLNYVKVEYMSSTGGVLNNIWVAVASTTIKSANQYRTLEIFPPQDLAHQCGMNSCGEKVYCWDKSVSSTPYRVSISAASLIDNNDARCTSWGGTFPSDSTHRCLLLSGTKRIYYPAAFSPADGIIDMTNNSFNGSFNTYTGGGNTIGIAEGKSGTASGQSGTTTPYVVNFGMQTHIKVVDGKDTIVIDNYGSSTPVVNTPGTYGDDMQWSFYLSYKIDSQAPLIETVSPGGDEAVADNMGRKVEITFDRLMRQSTLKPGWNYDDVPKDRAKRYLILDTITPNANTIGYWIESQNLDKNGNGVAYNTRALIAHNPFDSFIKYEPLVGYGVQSNTQNCFLPAGGPQNASSTVTCDYLNEDGKETSGCVNDASNGSSTVKLPNPASYGYLNCNEVVGTSVCDPISWCVASYFNSAMPLKPLTWLGGSLVITKDYQIITGTANCCFGVCAPDANPSGVNNGLVSHGPNSLPACAKIPGAQTCSTGQVCTVSSTDPDNFPGIAVLSNDKWRRAGQGKICCMGVCQ